MITHFEAAVALMAAIVGMLGALTGAVWKARGWVDRLNTTDGKLAAAITDLSETQKILHRENQRRFEALESQIANGIRRTGRPQQ